jgi:hypothetical protein
MTTLIQFIHLIDERLKKGTLYDINRHVKSDVVEEYRKHSKNLKDEFFGSIERDLRQNNFQDLSSYVRLLIVEPFTEEDHERFQGIIMQSIRKIKELVVSTEIAALADFVWVLLDHMLHYLPVSNEESMTKELKDLKASLKQFEPLGMDEIDLLYQKLGHYGI